MSQKLIVIAGNSFFSHNLTDSAPRTTRNPSRGGSNLWSVSEQRSYATAANGCQPLTVKWMRGVCFLGKPREVIKPAVDRSLQPRGDDRPSIPKKRRTDPSAISTTTNTTDHGLGFFKLESHYFFLCCCHLDQLVGYVSLIAALAQCNFLLALEDLSPFFSQSLYLTFHYYFFLAILIRRFLLSSLSVVRTQSRLN